MAFGSPPKHLHDFKLDNLDKEHFLVLATEAVSKLDWNMSVVCEIGLIAYTKLSWSSWGEEVTVKIDNGVVNVKSKCIEGTLQLIDWGKNKKNIDSLLSKVEELKSVMAQSEIENKLAELQQQCYASKYAYKQIENAILNKPPSTTKEKITDLFSILKPTEGYFISPILAIINILIFIVMLISGVHLITPEKQDLLNWGANFHPLTLEGQWWRLFTACFLHIGIFHLLSNMLALLYIGIFLETYLGKIRFVAAYLISGIAASLISLWWHDLTITAGASGAIFGMYGVFLALLTTNLLHKSVRKDFLTGIVVFIGYNIYHGLKPNSGIDNPAHIGGLLSGIIIGYAFVPSLKQFENKVIRFLTIGVLTIVILISSFTVYRALSNDIGQYKKKMDQFGSMESMALEVYNLPEGTPNEKLLSEIKDRGLYYWNENIKLIDSFKDLYLPLQTRARNSKLKEYCELRIQSYKLLYKAIDEDTDKYENEINEYNKKIETIITKLTDK